MYSKYYDINRFLNNIKNKNFHDIIECTQEEICKTEHGSYGIKGAVKKRESGSIEYIEELKSFIFFISHGIKPANIDESLFQSFKLICQSLVEKKQLKPNIMTIFNNN